MPRSSATARSISPPSRAASSTAPATERSIRADGSVDGIDMERSSGLKVLDQAAFRIVRMVSPYAAFPDDIRRDTDILVITRTWFFGPGDKIWTE